MGDGCFSMEEQLDLVQQWRMVAWYVVWMAWAWNGVSCVSDTLFYVLMWGGHMQSGCRGWG